MILFVFCCAVGLAVFFPETPAGKALHRVLIEWPADKLNRVSWPVFGFWLLVMLAIVAVIEIMGMEGVQISAVTVPELIAWFVAFDVATYLDIIVIVWTVAALANLQALYERAKSAAGKSKKSLTIRARARRIRAARSRRTRARHAQRHTAKGKDDGRRDRRVGVRRQVQPSRHAPSGRAAAAGRGSAALRMPR